MREDFIETLDKMFPAGYLIMYTCPDGQIRFGMYNPKRLVPIEMWREAIIESLKTNPPETWKGDGDE